jgi:hypothetical protein
MGQKFQINNNHSVGYIQNPDGTWRVECGDCGFGLSGLWSEQLAIDVVERHRAKEFAPT